jgi:2-desacetyl-2-hydroxyethyl bacteriochlorophyllide A dehydrogenase
MSREATAVVIHGAGDVQVESRTVGPPTIDQALVAVELGGICGSDISYYRHGAVGSFKVRRPMILGHEVVGRVAEVGVDSAGLDDGARVAVDPSSPCGVCDRCTEGRSNICLQPTFLGSASTNPHTDGGFVSLLPTGIGNLVRLEDSLDDKIAVFAEPLAVTVHAVNRAGGVIGAKVLIVGAGPIGAMLAAACIKLGAADVAVSDVNPARLETVTQVGVETTFVVGEQEPGVGYDVVFDASGAGVAIGDALSRVRRGGRLVLVGLPHSPAIELPLPAAITGEVDIVGSFRFNHNEFVHAVDLLHNGLDLAPLRSGSHIAEDADAALTKAAGGSAMKVQLEFGHFNHGHTHVGQADTTNQEQPNA